MKPFEVNTPRLCALAIVTLLLATIGCGRDPLLGIGTGIAALSPSVTAVTPAVNASGVPINTRKITVAFNKPMNALTINTNSFTLDCPAATPIIGSVSYTSAGSLATLTVAADLPMNIICDATITTGVQDNSGNALTSPYVWHFTTAATIDTIAPTVISTVPAAGATNVGVNSLVTAVFSEAMDPASLDTSSFTLQCPTATPVSGTVTYAINSKTASFVPASNLPANVSCTATIGTGAKDVAGNALATPYVWIFSTGAGADMTPPTVLSSNPADASNGNCVNKTVNVTFSEAMDPLSINTTTFSLAVTGGAVVSGTVSYDAVNRIATLTPSAHLIGTPATSYTVTVKGGASGVKDLAGNALTTDRVTHFVTNSSTCATAPVLGAAATFGAFGGSSTLTNDGLNTVINGDVAVNAASSTVTGLHDSGGNVYTITGNNNGVVNGLIYTQNAPPGSVAGATAMQARSDALSAYNAIAPGNLPGGIDVSNIAQCGSCGGAGSGADKLAGRTLPAGIYLSATGTYDIGGGAVSADLVLDAQGDANAVWIFQTAAGTGTLNVGVTGPAAPAVPIHVLLINGAQAKNVFWYIPAGAAIGTGSTMTGTLLSNAGITLSTTGGSPPTAPITTLNGRAIALTAGVTMTNTVVNLPAP